MFGSFYSKFVFPYSSELAMSGDLLNGFWKDEFKENKQRGLGNPTD